VILSEPELIAFAERLAAEGDRWLPHVHHDPDARVYELIWDDEDVNAWLICWSEDQDTGFHDHDISAAAITVLSGSVREDRLRLSRPPSSRVANAGDTLLVEPNAIHRVLHAGDGPAVTIHAYSPPLTRTGAYWVGDAGQLQRVSQSFEQELRGDHALA
jgi:quercetin dioxygenase-like cupin family protein